MRHQFFFVRFVGFSQTFWSVFAETPCIAAERARCIGLQDLSGAEPITATPDTPDYEVNTHFLNFKLKMVPAPKSAPVSAPLPVHMSTPSDTGVVAAFAI